MYSIYTENLIKQYRDKEILKGVNLKISEGEFYALMGPNGAGKSTLVSILSGVKTSTAGKVQIYGKIPQKAKQFIGYVPQKNFSCPELTGRENIKYFSMLYGYSKKRARSIADKLLREVGLINDANKKVFYYSGGMRKKLEIATALFPGIKILIFDEPTTGLDPSARRNFFDLLRNVKRKETTILLITHIGSDAEFASKVGFMDNGKIVLEGTPKELKSKSGLKSVIMIKTSVKNEHIKNLLKNLGEKFNITEIDEGYRIYSKNINMTIPKIIRLLEKEGCGINRIEAFEPSLEDVFFAVTGKKIRETRK